MGLGCFAVPVPFGFRLGGHLLRWPSSIMALHYPREAFAISGLAPNASPGS
jgi:hypothetical protein